jgi:putative flippase GtrA
MDKIVNLGQILRYGAANFSINIGGYLIFLLLLWMGVEHKFAASLLYIASAIVSFSLNRKFVFDSKTPISSSFYRYLAMMLGGYIFSISMLYIFVDHYHYRPEYIQLVSFVIVSLFFYFINKFFVHKS